MINVNLNETKHITPLKNNDSFHSDKDEKYNNSIIKLKKKINKLYNNNFKKENGEIELNSIKEKKMTYIRDNNIENINIKNKKDQIDMDITPLKNINDENKRSKTPTNNFNENKLSTQKRNLSLFQKKKDNLKLSENSIFLLENKKKKKKSESDTEINIKKVENLNKPIYNKKLDPNYDTNSVTKSESNYAKKKNTIRKKNVSINEQKFHLCTPLRINNKINKNDMNKSAEKNNKIDKWYMDEHNLNKLPEEIKNEYISYLGSPLKRSERLIKTKINKLLNKYESINNSEQYVNNSEQNGNKNNIVQEKKLLDDNICDFIPEQEEKCWDNYYTQSVDKKKPFTGISTETAVYVITQLLKSKIKKIKNNDKEYYSPIYNHDTIMEIGHGNHPLAVQMYEQWGTVGKYIGIEFSGEASKEALKCKKLYNLLKENRVEFIKILSVDYYINDHLNGIVIESNISPENTVTDFIKLHTFKYIFAKSTLDYITCRMDNIGNCSDWKEDLQISPTVVKMFDSLSNSLQVPKNNKIISYIIFVEPNDFEKFRDHILTIFKVIYTATFKYNSSAKYLRLYKINSFNKASGYMIEKRNDIFKNFDELRQHTIKLILKSPFSKYIDDIDWFLPSNEPKKWLSNYADDIEYLVNLDNGKI